MELNKNLCAAAVENCTRNGVNNVKIVACDSEKFASIILRNRTFVDKTRIEQLPYEFRAVVVDPPRCGLDAKTRQMLANYDFIIYISCNPEALMRDLEQVIGKYNRSNFIQLMITSPSFVPHTMSCSLASSIIFLTHLIWNQEYFLKKSSIG